LVWTWNILAEQLINRDIHAIRTGKGVKKMFWAGFGYNTRTGLILLDGDPEAPRGGISSRVIEVLYAALLPQLVQEGDIFMHDNAPVHTAAIIKAILAHMRIEVMIWPPYSPDLNPIENLWALMKAIIYERHPDLEYACDNQETLARLIEAAIEAWHAIDQRVLQKLSDTMPHRVQAVLTADGWYTHY
jgi:transposase